MLKQPGGYQAHKNPGQTAHFFHLSLGVIDPNSVFSPRASRSTPADRLGVAGKSVTCREWHEKC